MPIVYKSDSTGESDFSDSLDQKYQIKNLQYPANLDSSPEYGKNKVVFFINVQGAGKFAANEGNAQELMDIPPSEYTKYLAGKRVLEGIGEVAKKVGVDLTVTKKMKRLKSAIVLYVPNAVRTSYSVNWTEDDFLNEEFKAELALEAGKMIAGQDSNIMKTAASGMSAKVLNGMNYVQKATQITPGNSKAEQLFKGVNFRDFTFDYQFAPKSEEEAASVLNIIRMFRHHMLPEFKDQANFLYIYPSEFEIRYYRGAKENDNLEKIMTCVLTNVIVDYTPNGQFTTFPNGMPQQINMSLTFRELAVPTKETSPFNSVGV